MLQRSHLPLSSDLVLSQACHLHVNLTWITRTPYVSSLSPETQGHRPDTQESAETPSLLEVIPDYVINNARISVTQNT
jgi:hypothetical protein